MTATAIPYGFWPSAWTAERAASASRDFAELRAGHGGLFWLEYRPEDGRCTLWFQRGGQTRCLTPEGVSLRSRVYEYGGGAFCLTGDGVAFVDEADQQVYRQALDGVPRALTAQGGCRYGDLHFAAARNALLVVEESHEQGGVVHRLVSLSLADGQREVLGEGADFYASPCLSPDGERLAWIEWSRPEQPWTATRLCVATRDASGRWSAPIVLAAGDASVQQPRFSAEGRLHALSDRLGWWQPWCERDGVWQPLDSAPADHAPAPWQLGTCSYLPLADGGLLLSRFEDGYGVLVERDADGQERRLAESFSRFRQLGADTECFYCIAAAPDRLPTLLAIRRDTGAVQIVAGGEQPLAEVELSRPESLRFASGEGEASHAFFYPPRNAGQTAAPGTKPPLVVFLHGGPTSACYPVFDPRIQFWTQRGFAVADLNYRGSSGFGRAYRQRLRDSWGVVDVEDAVALVRHLAERGAIDPARAFIRGSSAGGYTALCGLAFTDAFAGGASLYGVSDPLALGRVTHKFEADYLDWLIGDPERDLERYRARTPLLHAGRIQVPVIFFQGGLDAVVVPAQTESMVAALRERGVPVEYHLYPDERHGFRQAAHLSHALEREFRFYQRVLVEAPRQ
ncbi:S9 family peptidase [Pseudomonas indica]|uniref:S9 family peptidase n=1 Tax=Pseudomonas indica TaxID=137658 RepID=UPI000BAB3311|nr:S9 family peptidase [Pseudomonas indica]PAU61522.1 S9 family peptidase [Pseudomonas indica]